MKRRWTSTVFTAAALAAALGGTALVMASGDDDDRRDRAFTNRTIRGAWGWSGSGWVVPPVVDEAVPTVGRGIVRFDGRGRCSVQTAVNINGTPFGPVTSDSCTYSVNRDGTGTSVAHFSSGPFVGPAPVSFVISDRGREIRFIQENAFVVTFIAKRQ